MTDTDTHAVFPDRTARLIDGQDVQVGDIFNDGAMVASVHRHENENYPNQADRPFVIQCSKVIPGPDGQPVPTDAEKRPRYIPPRLATRVFRTGEAPEYTPATQPEPETPVTQPAAIQGVPSTPEPVVVVDLAAEPETNQTFADAIETPLAPEAPLDCACGRATTRTHLCHGGGYTCVNEGQTRNLRPYGFEMDTHACDGHWAEFTASQPAPAVAAPAPAPVPAVETQPVAPAPASVETPVGTVEPVAQSAPPVDPEDPATLAPIDPADEQLAALEDPANAPAQIDAEDLKKLKQSTKRLAKKYSDWVTLGEDGISITSKIPT